MDWSTEKYANMTLEEAQKLKASDLIGFGPVIRSIDPDVWMSDEAKRVIASKHRYLQKVTFYETDNIMDEDFCNIAKVAYARCLNCKNCPEDRVVSFGDYVKEFHIEGCYDWTGCRTAAKQGFQIQMNPGSYDFNESTCPFYEPNDKDD